MNRTTYKIALLLLSLCMICGLSACGSSNNSFSFNDLSKKTTIDDIKGSFGNEDFSYETDYYDAIGYEELTLAGIYAEVPSFFFVPDSGTLMRIEFECSNKGVTKDAIEQLIKDLTKTDGRPTVEDRSISGDYCTCYYWNNKTPEFKCIAFLVDEDRVMVLLNYDWWFETIGF